MASSPRKRSRPLRRMARTFFAHRFWLLAMVVGASLATAIVSVRQPKTYVGRMELAYAADAHSTPVLLPDVVRLRQLVFNPENLAALTPTLEGRESSDPETLSRIAKSMQLDPLSNATSGSGVWRLQVQIPASNAKIAGERLDQYAARIDEEFHHRVQLAKKQAAPSSPSGDARVPVAPVAHFPENAPPPGEAPTAPILQIGVEPSDVSDRVAELQGENENRIAELDRATAQAAGLAEIVAQLEANPPIVSPEIEAQQPALRALRQEFDRLLEQRARRAAYLKPAHPDYQAIDRRIQSAEAALGLEITKLAKDYRAKWTTATTAAQRLRDELARVPKPLDARDVQKSETAIPPATDEQASPTSPEVPRPLPDVAARSFDPSAIGVERPVGRVVLPSPSVDPHPIQPTTFRNVAFSACAALAVYLLFVVIRAGSDTRIHSMDEIEDLGVSVFSFGSIPSQCRAAPPVRFISNPQGATELRS